MPKTVRQTVFRFAESPPAALKTIRYRMQENGVPKDKTKFVTCAEHQ